MKKVLIAFEGMHFSEGAFEFARRMNEQQRIHLTGAFLPQVQYANLWSYSGGGTTGSLFIPLVEDDNAEVIEKNMERFKSLCIKYNINYHIYHNFFDFTLLELKKQTRFADLMILGSQVFYENPAKDFPNEFLDDALHKAECPILLVPETFAFPESNILAYDGSESSVYAIKQFVYLFPEFCDNKTLLVYSSNDPDVDIPDKSGIKDLAACHFNALSVFKLSLNPKKFFSTWISERKGAILVTGSYGRSTFSQLFKRSFVSGVISNQKLPVFISHK